MAATEEIEKEILAEMAANPVPYAAGQVNDVITIDGETRMISVPASEIFFGVESDKDVERKHFRCPKVVGDGIDLSKHQIYISYITSDSAGKTFSGNAGLYLCEDVATDGDDITFSWQLSGNVFASAGFIAFKVLAAKTDGENVQTRWNTVPAIGTVLMTVPDGMDIGEAYPDIVTQLLERMASVEKIATEEAMQGYVNTYLEAHPGEIDETLTDPKKAAPASVVGELKEDINDIVTKHSNYLLSLNIITGKFYNHKSTSIGTAAENVHTGIYGEIPIKGGIKYYYKNFYAYFCNIVYNDGSIVALSETTNGYESGEFTAEKDGKILITVSLYNTTQCFMFTDDEKFNKYYYYFKENVYESKELRSLFIEPVLLQTTNYKNILPDCNNAKIGGVYRFDFAKNETNFPKNTPLGDSYNVNNISLLICFGKMTSNVSFGDYQLFFSDETIYRRQYSGKLSSDGTNYEYYWGKWNIVAQKNKETIPKVIVVDKNGNGDYTSLLAGILYATESMDSTVYVRAGVYDLISEFEDYYGTDFFTNYSSSDIKGIILKNRVSVIFDTQAHVSFNYTGDNNNVKSFFSPFNSGAYGFTLDNLDLKASNCRYNIHDERASNTDGYKNTYKNCSLYIDNSKNTAWSSRQCIGGGLGTNGNIIVENCIFESIGLPDTGYGVVSWHNSKSSKAKNNMTISGNYIKGKGTFRLSWYGNSKDISVALVNNNSFGSAIQSRAETNDGTSPNVNTEIIEWNNVIRTD